MELQPNPVLVDPVFEIDNAPGELAEVLANGTGLPQQEYRWDGHVLWVHGTWNDSVKMSLRFTASARALLTSKRCKTTTSAFACRESRLWR